MDNREHPTGEAQTATPVGPWLKYQRAGNSRANWREAPLVEAQPTGSWRDAPLVKAGNDTASPHSTELPPEIRTLT